MRTIIYYCSPLESDFQALQFCMDAWKFKTRLLWLPVHFLRFYVYGLINTESKGYRPCSVLSPFADLCPCNGRH